MDVAQVVTLIAAVAVGTFVIALDVRSRVRRGRMTPLRWGYLAVGVPWGLLFAYAADVTVPPSPPPLTFVAYIGLVVFWPFPTLASLAGWFGVVEGGRALHEDMSVANHLYVAYMFISAGYLAVIVAAFVLRTFLVPPFLALYRGLRTGQHRRDEGR